MLKKSPHCGSTTFDLVLSSVSLNARGWENTLLVDVQMTGSTLVEKSRFLVVLREYTSLTSTSFSFGAIGERLVIGFLGGIFPVKNQYEI
jgi:hypothetical protein